MTAAQKTTGRVFGREDEQPGAETGTPRRRAWGPALAAAVVALCLTLAVAVLYLDRNVEEPPGDRSPEAGFVRDMAIHHQQAVEMSFIIHARTRDPEVRSLAFDIANTQANQRGMMRGWLDIWGLTISSNDEPMAWVRGKHAHHHVHDGSLMPGMATKTELDRLRHAKTGAAEVQYLRLMIRHHKGGVEMAREAVELSDQTQVHRLAQNMLDAQESEIELMRGMLKERGATP